MTVNFAFHRIVVIGTTSSGKSTVAQRLAKKLDYDFIELDALHWGKNWMETPDDTFRQRMASAVSSDRWVAAGNYSIARDLTWPRAEALIWLDYPLWTIFWQLTRRTFTRWWTQELLWETNRKNFWTRFKLWSEDSLYHWLFKTCWRHKPEYPQLFRQPEHAHLRVFHFQSLHETKQWMDGI